jgi:putative endonuclease
LRAKRAAISIVRGRPDGFTADGFTKEHGVKMLVYYEQHATAIAAIQRDKNIKHWSRKWKIDLIRSMNPDWLDLWGDIVRRPNRF